MKTLQVIAVLAGLALTGMGVHAAPPSEGDLHYSEWFLSLKQPGSGVSCCSISDCRMTDLKIEGQHYWAKDQEGNWLEIPDDKILRISNPTARAVLCAAGGHVYCFVPPSFS